MRLTAIAFTMLMLTGCSVLKRPPTELPKGLTPILMDYRMVHLTDTLEGKEREYLERWLRESLIPYVSWLEAR